MRSRPSRSFAPDPRGGLQVVTFHLRAQPPHHEGINIGRRSAHAHDAAAPAWTGGHHAPGRSFGHRDQDGSALDESPLFCGGLTIGELPLDATEHGGGDSRHIIVDGSRGGMKNNLAARRKTVGRRR
jgi:hypothetical protein